ncbi:MAG TPA: phosphatase PAP2 family protein [Polyangiaceae bacterium]|jgi:membrane-associated phospholipid phosphatase|nr:phosphatase PAP2 family protein [Polyangiaceae bacterium]
MSQSAVRGGTPRPAVIALYFIAIAGMVYRIAYLDEWSAASWCALLVVAATARPDRIPPEKRNLVGGVFFFALLSTAVAYLPNLWFAIAFRLNHASHYLWNANAVMTRVPGNDGRFLWSHDSNIALAVFRWVYLSGFDMVVWIPVVRALLGFDAVRTARYALGAHLIQFPLIMPFYTAIRVDEVWSVLGHADRCARGWSDEVRHDLGANCFPSMHTSVAFAVLLIALREKSRAYRWMMIVYSTSIMVSTVYLEIHWLIDVLGGVLLGTVSVRIADAMIALARSRAGQPQPDARSIVASRFS